MAESGTTVFTGVHERQLDERGRVALPSSFRSSIGEHCYLTFGEDACVKVLSESAFRTEAEKMIDDVNAGRVSRSRQRAYASSVLTVSPDKQGRILLDAKLRDYAGIDVNQPVVVVGVLDRIEVWDPVQFENEEASGKDELAGATSGPEQAS
ncbi:division/cell wall cluster transcriptional repressor MraZ [Ilumatobacter coccineus]|uniref:division/cell wall cluster transcriptional repressor MraZ n=1 Tax=Ilumatobacter coccineus TaxID=467094 RepID=UPI000348FC6E|nr:hypothetical protein [Ilumatobacter coccineus]